MPIAPESSLTEGQGAGYENRGAAMNRPAALLAGRHLR